MVGTTNTVVHRGCAQPSRSCGKRREPCAQSVDEHVDNEILFAPTPALTCGDSISPVWRQITSGRPFIHRRLFIDLSTNPVTLATRHPVVTSRRPA